MRAGPPPRAQQIYSIVFLLVVLVALLLTHRQCGNGTASLLRAIDGPTAPQRSAPPASSAPIDGAAVPR